MKIRAITALATLPAMLAGAVLAVLLFQMLDNQRAMAREQDGRLQSYQLADALRQSSDDLTNMARTYVLTGESGFRDNYHAILAIRNGEQPRPERYSSVYWWLQGSAPPRGAGAPASLRELMRQAGFTQHEMLLLEKAQRRSDQLVRMEQDALGAMAGHFRDAAGKFTIRHVPDPAFARSLLFGERYRAEKAAIMEPIQYFMMAVETRTAGALKERGQRQTLLIQLALACLAVSLLCALLAGRLQRLRPRRWAAAAA